MNKQDCVRLEMAESNITLCHWLFALLMAVPSLAIAGTLAEAFAGFRNSQFDGFYYAEWESPATSHPYLVKKGLKPYKDQSDLYHFKVKETLFGMPVSEIIIPGTWELHAVVFDVPLATAQKAMKRRFGTTFAPSAKSAAGEAPALEIFNGDPARSALYCDAHEAGGE